MVRFIDLIKHKKRESDRKVSSLPEVTKSNQGDSKENRPAQTSSTSQRSVSIKKTFGSVFLRKLYRDMLHLARDIMEKVEAGEKIPEKEIRSKILDLVNIFEKDLYNVLMLFSYFSTPDNYLFAHMINNAILSIGFSTYLGASKKEIEALGFYGFLHDVGMAGVLHLYEEEGALTPEKIQMITRHPFKSVEILKGILSEKECDIILDVHERENGQGYPRKKHSSEISPWSKILSICDIWEALTHPRKYRDGLGPLEAMKILLGMKDTIIDKDILNEFIKFISVYPIGAVVYLNTNEVAVIIRSNKISSATPIVKVLLDSENCAVENQRIVDLSKNHLVHIKGSVARNKEKEIIRWFILEQMLGREE